jgi:glycosyltransferase involved in cell wall biosynthesis
MFRHGKRNQARRRPAARAGGVQRITMLLENNPYPQDVRVRSEAQSLVAAGHRVEVIAPRLSGQRARERVDGVEVRRFHAIDGTGQGLAGLLLEYLVAIVALHLAALSALTRGSTVLHIHNPPDAFFLAGGMFRLAGRRVVFDHHDLGPELVEVKFRRSALVAAARISERLTFAAATHVLAANESHAAIALERGRKRPDEVTVVRNGPPASWTRLPLNVRPGRLSPIRLAYVGAVAEQDGVDALAEVLAALRDRTPPVPALLTVVGDGDGRPSLEAALARLGLAGCVTLTGWVKPERVPELLRDADVCVDPAPGTVLNQRSTMIKLAEYLALGKPVVAFDLLETRRTVADAAMLAPTGNMCAFAERIAMLAEDPELRRGLAQRARERAGELTWEHSEAALLAAYSGFARDGELERDSG